MSSVYAVIFMLLASTRNTRGCQVVFPSGALESGPRDSDYDDPNNMGTYLFDSDPDVNLATNFLLSEFKCNDGSQFLRIAPELIECLQTARSNLAKPLSINSGYRTVSYNTYVGGASSSYHMSGTAADVDPHSSVSITQLADVFICECRPLFQSYGREIGLGLDATYIHIDMRPSFGTWTYSGASMSDTEWRSYIENKVCP
eukprot:UN01893